MMPRCYNPGQNIGKKEHSLMTGEDQKYILFDLTVDDLKKDCRPKTLLTENINYDFYSGIPNQDEG